ncbi:MAG: type II toxin-antitoxin system VapC family toxin [Fibrobacteria bacterium]|nr:type II toxin-antitoxin system VapC family toxin [Fibrobacteria bacterium]
MNLLLDTHILLWWLDNPSLIKRDAANLITDGKNGVYISSATIWEIVLKKSLGKLCIPDNLEEVITSNRFLYLPIAPHHAFRLECLPHIHRDPFDRILIAQALCEKYTLVTRDKIIPQYDLDVIEG